MKINKSKKLFFLLYLMTPLLASQQVISNLGFQQMPLNMVQGASTVQQNYTQLFDEEAHLKEKVAYLRAYNQLQNIVKALIADIQKKYQALATDQVLAGVAKDNKLVSDYTQGRYLKNMLGTK